MTRHFQWRSMWIYSVVVVSNFAKCCENGPVTVWEMLIKFVKSTIQGCGKMNCILYQGTDHTKSLSILPICRSNHNTNFQWNLLITLAVMLHTDRMTYKPTSSQNLSQLNVIHGFKMSTVHVYFIQVLSRSQSHKLINTHHYTTSEKNWVPKSSSSSSSLFMVDKPQRVRTVVSRKKLK